MAGCSSRAPATLPTEPAAPAALLFADEFDDAVVDESLWTLCYPWAADGAGCTNNPGMELQWYQTGNVAEAGGSLELTVRREQASNADYKFTSGIVTTGGVQGVEPPSFEFQYGYAEARVKVPSGRGMWPAFWLLATDYRFPPEVDILEYQGVDPGYYLTNVFYDGPDGKPASQPEYHDIGIDITKDFHTFAVDWQPESLTFYLDGKQIEQITDPEKIPDKPMYVLLNLAIGGWVAANYPPDEAAFPATYYVDWIRVWDRKPN